MLNCTKKSQQIPKAPHSPKLPCPGSVLLGVAMNLSLKLLLNMFNWGAVKKAMSSVISRGHTSAASTKNWVPKASEVSTSDIVTTEELCDQ